jgi:hypothetical protein
VFPPQSWSNTITAKQPARAQPQLTYTQSNKDKDRRRSDSDVMCVSHNGDTDMPPPRKMRRLSDHVQSLAVPKFSAVAVKTPERDDRDAKQGTLTPTSSTKGKEKEIVGTDTPMAASGSSTEKQLEDYSAFKGRGRYAKDFGS